MSCNCIEEFNKLLQKESGDPKACVRVSFRLDRRTNKFESAPSMSCEYRDKKKDGAFRDHPREHPISGEYCPFCGKKYDETPDEPPSDGKVA